MENNYRKELEEYVNSLIDEIDNNNLYKEKRLVLIDEIYGYLVSDLMKMKQKINPDIEVAVHKNKKNHYTHIELISEEFNKEGEKEKYTLTIIFDKFLCTEDLRDEFPECVSKTLDKIFIDRNIKFKYDDYYKFAYFITSAQSYNSLKQKTTLLRSFSDSVFSVKKVFEIIVEMFYK